MEKVQVCKPEPRGERKNEWAGKGNKCRMENHSSQQLDSPARCLNEGLWGEKDSSESAWKVPALGLRVQV